ncbi:MAG: monofunctional biosynthetic peptidoglycan transglycosylase [Nitrospiraceae bacterium]|nr:monofunctional biosynthetic peptidoglycan transglycosylase [Nitrospiraceae bacterium]
MGEKIKKILKAAVILFVLVFIASIGIYFVFPNIAALKKTNPKKTAFMQYRERQWREQGDWKKQITQRWVPYSRISPYLIKAVLIGEDDKFWNHDGFDFDAIEAAMEKDIKAKKFKFGASTISQQLAKNLYLSPSKSPIRKIKEAILTWRIEKNLTKKRILEIYLNVAEWGDGIFGIEAASRHYFGKPASALSPDEAARLASILPNPLKFSPLARQKYVMNRSRVIYNIMVRRGIVTREIEEAVNNIEKESRQQEQEEASQEDTQPEATVNTGHPGPGKAVAHKAAQTGAGNDGGSAAQTENSTPVNKGPENGQMTREKDSPPDKKAALQQLNRNLSAYSPERASQ